MHLEDVGKWDLGGKIAKGKAIMKRGYFELVALLKRKNVEF